MSRLSSDDLLSTILRGGSARDAILGIPSMPAIPTGFGQRPGPAFPPLPTDEANSLVSKLTHLGGSGLSYVGGALNKPGRAVRGLLGGHPEELASLIPFSDTLGITDQSNEVTGRKLLDQIGLTSPKQGEGFDWGDLAGFGAEVATDPLTALSFGGAALGKGGQIAKAIGAIPKTRLGRMTTTLADLVGKAPELMPLAEKAAGARGIQLADVMGEKLGGMVGVGLPFMHPEFALGSGAWAQKYAQGADALQIALRWSKPGQFMASLFDRGVKGLMGRPEQEMGLAATEAFQRAQQPLNAEKVAITRLLQDSGTINQPELLRQVMEGTAVGPPAMHEAAQRIKALHDAQNALIQQHGGTVPMLQDVLKGVQTQATDASGNVVATLPPELERLMGPQAEYASRFKSQLPYESKGFRTPYSEKLMSPAFASQMERDPAFVNIPGGTPTIEKMVADSPRMLAMPGPITGEPENKAGALMRAAQEIRNKYLEVTPQHEQQLLDITKKIAAHAADARNAAPTVQELLVKNALELKVAQSEEIAKRLANMDPLREQAGLFTNHPVADAFRSLEGKAQASANLDKTIDAFINSSPTISEARPFGPFVAGNAQATMPMREALQATGIGDEGLREAAKRMGVSVEQAAKVQVPTSLVEAAGRMTQGFQIPKLMEPMVKLTDQFTNLFRPLSTVLWPAHNIKLWISGLWQNFDRGASDPRYGILSPNRWLKPQQEAYALQTGEKAIQGMASHPWVGSARMTDEQATRAVADMAGSLGLIRSGGGPAAEAGLEPAVAQAQGLLKAIPGAEPSGITDALKNYAITSKANLNPLAQRGVGGYTKDEFFLTKGGRGVLEKADNNNRLAAWIAYGRQGYTPEVAAEMVNNMTHDYSKLTDFERQVMRRVLPFYSFARLNTPLIAQQLMEHPGGVTAQALRAGNIASEGQGYVPPQVGQGTAIPLPGGAPGTQRFLSSLGLPYEPGLDVLQTGPGGLGRTAERALGQLNPLLKVPLELLTGRQFFSGRELGDLYQYPTESGTLNELAANTPGLGRALSTARTLTDPRKSWLDALLNTTTGARVTDVDMQKAMEIEGRKLVDQLLQSSGKVKEFTRPWVPAEERANLSPQEVQLMQLYGALEQRAQMAGLEKKAAAGDADARRRLDVMRAKVR